MKPKHLIGLAILVVSFLGVILAIYQFPNLKRWFARAAKAPANLAIDYASKTIPQTYPWRNLAQGGEDPSFSPKSLNAQLKPLQVQYLRLDHLYDFYINVQRDDQQNLTYDFSKLDSVIKEMRGIGITPFIALSYTPAVLNPDITGQPSSYTDYRQIVQATIQHISGKAGLNIPHVYYEVWNEPDLFGQWKTYGEKNYLDLYFAVSQAAAATTNTQPFKLGGPGTTKLYKNWVLALIKAASDHGVRLDFLSWHHYSPDPFAYKQDTDELKSWLEPYSALAQNLEIILSEWGPNSANDPIYDSSGGAAHLVASLSLMMPAIDRAFTFEVQDGPGPQQLWGRWGLFTHSNYGVIAKPRAQVFHLLNQLGPQQIAVNGQGGWVRAIATRQDQSLILILSNFDSDNLHAETVPLTLTSLPPGSYQLTQTYLNRPATQTQLEVGSDPLVLSLPMPANSVLLLTLTPVK